MVIIHHSEYKSKKIKWMNKEINMLWVILNYIQIAFNKSNQHHLELEVMLGLVSNLIDLVNFWSIIFKTPCNLLKPDFLWLFHKFPVIIVQKITVLKIQLHMKWQENQIQIQELIFVLTLLNFYNRMTGKWEILIIKKQ